jgi:hypothetical protein
MPFEMCRSEFIRDGYHTAIAAEAAPTGIVGREKRNVP